MAAKLAITDLLALSNSAVEIPRLGFGVYLSTNQQCVKSCLAALKVGYRHIDTAQYYGNEKEVGEAVRQSGLKREDVFVTTKIMAAKGGADKTYQSLLDSVKTIEGGEDGAVDLFLIHTASGGKADRKEMWQALEKLHAAGKTRSIGVSNYGIGQIEEMKEYAKIWPPQVNQLELHPWSQQVEIDEYCQKHGIVVEAYSPLVRNTKADDPTLNAIAKEYGVTGTQILIRYCLQKNWVPLPKSDTPSRIAGNADVYKFELSKEAMGRLDRLNQGSKGAIVKAVVNE